MITPSFDQTLIARAATGLYNLQLGNATMNWALEAVNTGEQLTVADLANQLYMNDFKAMSDADVAAMVVANVNISEPADVVDAATAYVAQQLGTVAADQKGAMVLTILQEFSALAGDPTYGSYATAFNAQIAAAVAYAQIPGSVDVPLDQPESMANKVFTLTAMEAAGADVMRLTGDQDARIDFSNPANQVTGLDLDGDGTIEFNGSERSVTGVAADFEIVDAYSRNPLDHTDTANNFLGDIYYDGTGFAGDGVSTNGNIFLGGLGVDQAFGGVGNDFLAGGGIAQGRAGGDYLSGGRNADFFFAEFAPIDATDGAGIVIDGGTTADNVSAGNAQSAQDSDWLLIEASDDDEPVQIWLNDDNLGDNRDAADGLIDGMGRVLTRSGKSAQIDDVENVDASGNLYGFLDDVDVAIGRRASDDRGADLPYNYGYGSTAQLWISGSDASNIIVGGYDNDYIEGRDGNDLLMGGNLNFLNHPNLAGIWNDGRDELIGGGGQDNIVFETDGGIYEGGSTVNVDDGEPDTLWLTANSFGARDAATVTADGVMRVDLGVGKVGGLANFSGYGGADAAAATGTYTSDQTNYQAGYARAQVQDFESVIATGLGGVDYLAAGANDPELLFANQQNFLGFMGAVDLRGTDGANVLYASSGNYSDVLEGRGGDDQLSGGDGNDDFIFGTANEGALIGDGVDVIHRQSDADGDNIWDGGYERDFNIGGTSTTGASSLTVDLGTTDLSSADVALTSFSIKIDGVTFAVVDAAALMAANSAAEVATLVNTAFQALDARVSASASGNVITVVDTGGRDISDTVAEGYAVGGVVSNGAFSAQALFNPAGTSTTQDRLIYKSYEDRADNEGVDDDSVLGSTISLGVDAYAEDLVINFQDEDGDGDATTRIAEDQSYALTFTNLTTQDKVTITVNGVNYELTVGVDLDGNIIAAEDGVGDTQAGIQAAFLTRLTAFINTYMDDDTSAGEVAAALAGSTITLTQAIYNGEQTVFMRAPTVALTNPSGGEPPTVAIVNTSQHEVELLDFDGRNGELNGQNVLFIGETGVSRAILATAKNAGEAITGSEALVVDVGPNNLQDVVFGTTTVIPNNVASNSPLSTVPNGVALHGDDFLIGGNGNDVINGGTGDDRVEGSTGADVLDGGKNFYAVQVLGEPQARVYVLNKWEAANPTKVGALSSLTISSIQLINQSENGVVTVSGEFDDTLQFSQSLFTPGVTRFTVTLDDFALAGGVVELRNDGAGTVGVDVDGNGTIDHTTKFTNFENIRTVSGTGNAVAGSGQGNDTLDVTALSAVTTGAGGISYDLTNGANAGQVRYSTDAILTTPVNNDFPVAADYESLVLRVDGVENVIASTGADLLLIDETEAAKNNTFTAGLGVDRIEYQNVFAGEATDGAAEPTVTIKLDTVAASLGGTDTVTMTGGRVGSTVAVDTLGGVEYITLAGNTAESTRENDMLDVTAFASGATVSYLNGRVTVGGTTHVTIQGVEEVEIVQGGAGNDTVLVADSAVMQNNARNDQTDGTPDQNILFMTYLDYDDLNTGATTRKSFAAQVLAAQITQVNNQGQFSFLLGEAGAGGDADRVDYSAEDGRIVVAVGQETAVTPQYVVVDGNTDSLFNGAQDRVDALRDVEEIVASLGQSVLDFTAVGQARQITFQYVAPAGNPADKQVIEQTIRIADGSGNAIAGLNAFVEKYTYDAPASLLPAVADATWNSVQGSDAADVVIYQGSEDLVNQAGLDHRFTTDTLVLRGGANEVRYSPLETSVTAVISVTPEDTSTAGIAEGLVTATVTFQDGTGGALAGGGTHTITSHTSDNSTAAGTLKLEGSQDAEDTVQFGGLSAKTYILGTSPGVINVKVATASGLLDAAVLTGFEFVQDDGATNDVYDFSSLAASAGITLTDAGPDHDVIRVTNDAAGVAFNGGVPGNTTISLPALNTFFGFDFDVLDISALNNLTTLTTVLGEVAGLDDELVVGQIGAGATLSASDFEAVVVSPVAVTNYGSAYTLDTTANSLIMGGKTLQFNNNMNVVSFMGTALGDTTVAAVTSGVTVSVVGNENVTVWGSEGADTISSNGGDDTIRGGEGNDTVNAGNATGEVAAMTLGGGAAVLAAAETLTLTGNVATLVISASGGAGEIATASATADADQIGALLMAQTNAFLETELGYAPGSIASKSYDASSNVFTLNFTAAAGNVADLAAAVSAGTMTAVVAVTAPVAGGNDTFVFEATGAVNGQDTLNGVDNTDAFNFDAFLGAGNGGGTTETFVFNPAAAYSPVAATDVVIVANKGTLAASDFAAAATAGKFNLADGDVAVFAMTADATGAGGTAGIQPWNLYYVSNGAAVGIDDLTVTLVGTVNSLVELSAVDIDGMV